MRRRAGVSNVTPSAARLTGSLRDIGYDFPAAVADLVDNSLAAGAATVEITVEFAGADSYVSIADDGCGMTENGLVEAMRFGSRRDYGPDDLGRYGLGLKTASLSQCRSVTVLTRQAPSYRRITGRTLDLDLIADWDEWLVVQPAAGDATERANTWLAEGPGTVVIWESMDRVLPERNPEGGWARRRLASLAQRTAEHLGMVFHRYLEGRSGGTVTMTVNGDKVRPWNPFAPGELARKELPVQRLELTVGEMGGVVTLAPYVLPSRDQFSSLEQFERLSGPLNWNRQQGLYVYRADRLVQYGGWNGMRGIDEHTKLARAALDFSTDLDTVFNINVAKMRVSIPSQLKTMLDRPIHELCITADDAYRKTSRRGGNLPQHFGATPAAATGPTLPVAGLALRSAAMRAGEYHAFEKIVHELRQAAPDISASLGLTES